MYKVSEIKKIYLSPPKYFFIILPKFIIWCVYNIDYLNMNLLLRIMYINPKSFLENFTDMYNL